MGDVGNRCHMPLHAQVGAEAGEREGGAPVTRVRMIDPRRKRSETGTVLSKVKQRGATVRV